MRRARFPIRLVLSLGLLVLGAQAGCAQHRIPAIDPTGENLFAGTTTLSTHELFAGRLFHKHQQQAVAPAGAVAVAPPAVKPPCLPPIEVVPVVPVVSQPLVAVPQNPLPVIPVNPVSCGPQQMQPQLSLPGRPQPGGLLCATGSSANRGPELTVMPGRIVAPVNTEVVMAAGICSPDGYYVTRQPLEWMLAQDGVGQIVAVGHESPRDASFLLRNSPQKVATNYARAHTSTIAQTLNRGTPSTTDDICLQKGQSWISITSPTEGTSHVVVWAPKELNWERRKATATIYWVDAAWRFPQSVSARAGRPQPLTTVLTRSGGEPISGWLVRYEVVDGPPATFLRGSTNIEVRTDGAGRATADIVPASPEAGITTVRVQVIRPAARGDLPQMVVGQGVVGVQWTMPGLAVRAIGSSTVASDGTLGYRVEVTNSGDLATHNVALSYTPPTGVTVLNSTPAAQVFGQRLEWRLGDLPPGTSQVVELNCRATVAGSIRSAFVATSAEVPKAEGRVTTDVTVNALSVKMTGPEAVEVGAEAKFLIDVTNTGNSRLTNVTARDIFDHGLSHADGEQSPLVRALSAPLEPGQTDRFAISFIVTQPGRQCHRLDVTADGGHSAGARGCVTGTSPMAIAPQLSVRVTGPPAQRAGEVAQYVVEVKNSGTAPANNVELAVTWGLNLELLEATQGHEDELARLTTRWRIVRLEGGETITRKLNCQCLNADEQGASVRATVRSQQTSAVTSQTTTVILPGVAAPPPRTVPQPSAGTPIRPEAQPPANAPLATSPPAAGSLRITATALANPIMVNTTTTLLMSVTNDRSVPDQEVGLSVQVLGDGLAIRAGTTPTPAIGVSPSAIDFAPLREMRPGESLPAPYRLEVRGIRPGPHKIRVTATSSLTRPPAVTEIEIVVNAP
jgi:uncharacterized repeat protein (TIGR01451 family)